MRRVSERGCTLDSQVSMLYHMTEAQALGSWLILEMTTMGRDIVWIHARTHTPPSL
jgi:hypothetical protein